MKSAILEALTMTAVAVLALAAVILVGVFCGGVTRSAEAPFTKVEINK